MQLVCIPNKPHGNQEYKEQSEKNPELWHSQLGPDLNHGQDPCNHWLTL